MPVILVAIHNMQFFAQDGFTHLPLNLFLSFALRPSYINAASLGVSKGVMNVQAHVKRSVSHPIDIIDPCG